jgi:hypothetical protein
VSGYDGYLDVPDEPVRPSLWDERDDKDTARCSLCNCELYYDDDPSCGEAGCPEGENMEKIEALANQEYA